MPTIVEGRLDDALARARQEVMARGGLITVALGQDVELPKRWQSEPRVYPMQTVGLSHYQIHDAMPSNTRIVILTDRIPTAVFQPIHKEIKKRHINYLVRKSPEAVDDELKRWIAASPPVVDELAAELPPPPELPTPEPPPPPPPELTAAPAIEPTPEPRREDDDVAKRKAEERERGSVTKFVLEHANLKDQRSSVAEEARRLFRIAQVSGVKTTLNSLAQCIAVQKRKHGYGSRPDSVSSPAARTEVSLTAAIDTAMTALGNLRDAVLKMDKEFETLKTERDDLKARFQLISEAFRV